MEILPRGKCNWSKYKLSGYNAGIQYSVIVQEWKSNLLRVTLGITSFWSGSNSRIHSQKESTLKSDSNHYFGVDSTRIWEWIQLPNMTPKRVDFHSTALREYTSTTVLFFLFCDVQFEYYLRAPLCFTFRKDPTQSRSRERNPSLIPQLHMHSLSKWKTIHPLLAAR